MAALNTLQRRPKRQNSHDLEKMINRKKDVVSESSDNDSDNNLEISEVDVSHVDKSINQDLESRKNSSDSESNSENNCSGVNAANETRDVVSVMEHETTREHSKSDKHAKALAPKSIFNFEDLTTDDEIYVFQCPATFSEKELLGKNLLGKIKQTVDNKTEVYQSDLVNFEKKLITVALPNKSGSGSLIKVPVKGQIILDKVIEMTVSDHMTEEKHDGVAFPKDIKTRHPLLGVDWEAHIKETNEVLKGSSFLKKSKKIKKEKLPDIEVDVNSLKRESSIIEPDVPAKKKKKH